MQKVCHEHTFCTLCTLARTLEISVLKLQESHKPADVVVVVVAAAGDAVWVIENIQELQEAQTIETEMQYFEKAK